MSFAGRVARVKPVMFRLLWVEKNTKWRLQADLACDSGNDVDYRGARDHQTGIAKAVKDYQTKNVRYPNAAKGSEVSAYIFMCSGSFSIVLVVVR